MDNAGDWLYIVFLVVAAVSGLLNSGKKKKTATKPVQPARPAEESKNPDSEKSFWEILEERTSPPQPVQKKPSKRIASPASAKKETPIKAKNTPSPAQFLTFESQIPDFSERRDIPIELEETNEPIQNLTGDDFNLQDINEVRKAVLYNEILTRKY